jgi:FkbM family methyltransferase
MAMAPTHKWFGALLLHSPASIRSLRNIRVLGRFIHYLSHRILPTNERLCLRVQAGPAQGIRLEVNPRTGDAYLRGELEIETQKILVERLRPGMVFYDLGANIGLFSLIAARLVGAGGRVFSFEPDAEVAARLRRNIELNGFSNITVVEAAIWSANTNVRFVASDASSPERGTGKLLADEDQADGTRVRCIALDDFIQTAPPPDAIKCDVEGAELEALRGAKRLLEARRPWIICEMHSEANDRATRDFLGRLGYDIESPDVNHLLGLPRPHAATARARA